MKLNIKKQKVGEGPAGCEGRKSEMEVVSSRQVPGGSIKLSRSMKYVHTQSHA